MMDKENLFKRLRDAMGVSHIKDMTPKEINDVFQNLHDKNEALRAENEALKANQNKLRAQAVRDALYAMDNMDSPCANDWLEYADKLERGEI